MLLIRTFIHPSTIHGIGVYADQEVARGAQVWEYLEGFDPVYPASILTDGPELVALYLKRHAYPHHLDPNLIMVDGDDCRYMNHSGTPNIVFPRGEVTGFALRDIAPGEELTCDYNEFASGWYEI